jgi:predicted RNA binding protein with dsRBD fold (UPF0201 family)
MDYGKVVVEVEVRPTEDPEKVEKAIRNIFDPEIIDWETIGNSKFLIARSNTLKSLIKLYRLLRTQRILDAARSVLKKSAVGNRITFYLHKQALAAGKLSFVSGDHESPLGAVKITIEHHDVSSVIDWLSPPTEHGRPLWEREAPE